MQRMKIFGQLKNKHHEAINELVEERFRPLLKCHSLETLNESLRKMRGKYRYLDTSYSTTYSLTTLLLAHQLKIIPQTIFQILQENLQLPLHNIDICYCAAILHRADFLHFLNDHKHLYFDQSSQKKEVLFKTIAKRNLDAFDYLINLKDLMGDFLNHIENFTDTFNYAIEYEMIDLVRNLISKNALVANELLNLDIFLKCKKFTQCFILSDFIAEENYNALKLFKIKQALKPNDFDLTPTETMRAFHILFTMASHSITTHSDIQSLKFLLSIPTVNLLLNSTPLMNSYEVQIKIYQILELSSQANSSYKGMFKELLSIPSLLTAACYNPKINIPGTENANLIKKAFKLENKQKTSNSSFMLNSDLKEVRLQNLHQYRSKL